MVSSGGYDRQLSGTVHLIDPLEKVRVVEIEELNETLARLHDELAREQPLDEQARQRLQVLLGDIQSALSNDSDKGPATDDDSLGDRLQDAITEFEAAHPQFSQLIGRIADGLSNLGI